MDIKGLSDNGFNSLISNVSNRQGTVLPSEIPGSESAPDFSQVLTQAINKVNDLQQTAATKMHQVDSGESQDLLGTMIASQKSGISFQALLQVRNKAVAAYEEIMRMPV